MPPIRSWITMPTDTKRRRNVFDANGRQITHVVDMNSETGLVVRVMLDADGEPVPDVAGFVLVTETVPAPLRVEFLEDE